MSKPIKRVIAVGCLLGLLVPFSLKSAEKSAFVIHQRSYPTACAEEDNVMLKISPANQNIKGVNILAKKPVFNEKKYDVVNTADYSGCDWARGNYQTSYYYQKCSLGYVDRNKVCRPEVRETVLDNGKWRIIGDRGVHWQPFMNLINQDNQSVGEYKSLTIRRVEQTDSGGEPPTVIVIYSDGYLRPIYFARADEPSGWGGSFILGDSEFIKMITPRFYNNIKQIRIIKPTDENLSLELFFAKNPDRSAKIVIYHDYNRKGIDFFPPDDKKELLTFVSMYRDKTSFDIEHLASKEGDRELVYNVMDPLLDKAVFNSKFTLKRDNPSIHNTLAPDFEITGLYQD